MAVKNFKQYALDHTSPNALYTFEPPDQNIVDAGYKEQDFSGNGFHLSTRSNEPYEIIRHTTGNPVLGLDHYLQSTPSISENSVLHTVNPGAISCLTAYAWFKQSQTQQEDSFIFGQRKGSDAPCWAVFIESNNFLDVRVNGSKKIYQQFIGQAWCSVLIRKRFFVDANKYVVDVFLNNELLDTLDTDEYFLNPELSFKFFSQKGLISENGYKTPENQIAIACAAVWGRSLSDEEINNLHQASTIGVDIGGEGGIEIPGNGNTTLVSGKITENDLSVSRRVFAITQKALPISQSDLSSQAVLGEAVSDPDSGDYTINTTPYEGAVLVVAEDEFGSEWTPDTSYRVNDVIRPSTFQGYVYYCTSGGTSSDTEPEWWFDTDGSKSVGTAQFQAKPFSRPLAHGPIIPSIIASE